MSGGLLVFKDGSRFAGEIVRGSAKFQNSISEYGKDCTTASELCLEQVTKLKEQLAGFEDEKRKLNRRLDFVLDGGSETDAQKFKGEYKSNLERINLAFRDKQIQIEQLVQKAEALRENEFDWNGVGKRCEAILATIKAKDPVALKNAYRQLFEAIVVGDIGSDGKTDLKFVLRGQNLGPLIDSVNGRKEIRVGTKMAQLSFINTVEFPPPNIPIISNIQHLPLFKSECFLRQKYLEEMLSARQIAALTVSARSTVLKYLKEYQIPLRSEDEALLHRKGQLGYGERLMNRRIIAHKGELEIVERLTALRKQGFSYWKIADILNSMNVPTKNHGSRWHPTTVMKILKMRMNEESGTVESGKMGGDTL